MYKKEVLVKSHSTWGFIVLTYRLVFWLRKYMWVCSFSVQIFGNKGCVCVYVLHHRWLYSWPLVDGSVSFNGALRPNYSSPVTYSAALLPWVSFVFGASMSCVRPFLINTLLRTHTQAQVPVCLKVLMEISASAIGRDTPQSTTWHHGWHKTEGIVGSFVWEFWAAWELLKMTIWTVPLVPVFTASFPGARTEQGSWERSIVMRLLCFLTISFKTKRLTRFYLNWFSLSSALTIRGVGGNRFHLLISNADKTIFI